MKKVKSAVGLLLVIGLLLALGGCGSGGKNSLVGNWYNDSGRCLEIRSDGTYKLEGDYGTGHWKYLSDSKTYEFSDFYGDIQKFETGEDENGQYVKFWSEPFYKNANPDSEE